MKRTIILLLILPFSLQAIAKEKAIIQEGKGVASTREDAIKKAIFEAVAKAKGINVGSGKYQFDFESASADIERKPGGKEIGFDAVSIYAEGTSTSTAIRALVKTYEVLEEKKTDPNTWEVKLKVWIYDYQPPDKNERLRIAVLAPTTLSSQYYFGNIKLSDKDIQQEITHILNTKLVETNKFTILDRHYIDKVMQEKGLVLLGDASLEEKAKLGNLLGADYILTSTLNEAYLSANEKYLEAIGQKTYEHEAKFKMDYSLIGAATSQIKFSDSVNLWLQYDKDVRNLVPNWQDDKIDYRLLADELIKTATAPIVDKITGALYPARIAKIFPNNVIIINKGGKDIYESDIYDVLKEGQELFDYDTKESLGKIEEPVATIKIAKVMQNFSYATVVQGDGSKLSEGMICRKQGQELQKPIEQQSDTQVTPSGGVKMPFDK
ncbi:MAG: CsgG/HfaB family protein [Sedimentisphaerales bacterium]